MYPNPPVVPMTTFADYVITPGGGRRITLVRQQVTQLGTDYNPGRDFYRPLMVALREDIQSRTGTSSLERAVSNATTRSSAHFRDVADHAGRYVRRAQTATFVQTVGRWQWTQPTLAVRINPDFALLWPDGRVDIVKVYFKQPPLNRFYADAMLRLMEYSLPHLRLTGTPVVFDARRGKEWRPGSRPNPGLNDYLRSEALAYGSLWESMIA
jgi:hypothetical protein